MSFIFPIYRNPCLAFFLCLFLGFSKHLRAADIAFVGDSFSLGIGASENTALDMVQIGKILKGEIRLKGPISPEQKAEGPSLLWRGPREFYGTAEWVYSHLSEGLNRNFFMSPESSWSFLFAQKKGLDPSQVFISAEPTAKVEQFPRLIDRILDRTEAHVPQTVFVFFTSEDLCAMSMNGLTASDDYGNALFQGMKYILRNGKAAPGGSKVYFPHFLPLAQWLTKDDLRNHKVPFYGELHRCSELRSNGFVATQVNPEALPTEVLYLSPLLPPNDNTRCPSLFQHSFLAANEVSFLSRFQEPKRLAEIKTLEAKYLSEISTRIRNYRKETDLAVQKANEWKRKNMPHKDITFISVPETGSIEFQGEDLSNDCFHLSLQGQRKVADSLFSALGPKQVPKIPKNQDRR